MSVAVYPGSFDPITNGHIDIVGRAVAVFERVVIGVLANPRKTPLLPVDRRMAVLREAMTMARLPMDRIDWQSRAHFFAVASRAMRNVLIDHATRRRAAKRGGGTRVEPLHELLEDRVAADERPIDELIAINDALARLEQLDPRKARVVECRFFGGLSLEETAEALDTSPATVSRDWTFARAWLNNELSGTAPSPRETASPDAASS